jgi:hypothetical protein
VPSKSIVLEWRKSAVVETKNVPNGSVKGKLGRLKSVRWKRNVVNASTLQNLLPLGKGKNIIVLGALTPLNT